MFKTRVTRIEDFQSLVGQIQKYTMAKPVNLGVVHGEHFEEDDAFVDIVWWPGKGYAFHKEHESCEEVTHTEFLGRLREIKPLGTGTPLMQSAVHSIDGYFVSRVNEPGGKKAVFERAKGECLTNMRRQIAIIEEITSEQFLKATKR
jgi:hypothetical protein